MMLITLYIYVNSCPVKDEAVRMAVRHSASPIEQAAPCFAMTPKTEMAAVLKERANQLGMTVPDLVASYLDDDRKPAEKDTDQIAELDRRWAAIENGRTTIKHDAVVRWLDTWGTPGFKPWRNP